MQLLLQVPTRVSDCSRICVAKMPQGFTYTTRTYKTGGWRRQSLCWSPRHPTAWPTSNKNNNCCNEAHVCLQWKIGDSTNWFQVYTQQKRRIWSAQVEMIIEVCCLLWWGDMQRIIMSWLYVIISHYYTDQLLPYTNINNGSKPLLLKTWPDFEKKMCNNTKNINK